MKKNQRLELLAKEMSSFEVLELEPLKSITGGCDGGGGGTMNFNCGGADNAENGVACPKNKAAAAAAVGLDHR